MPPFALELGLLLHPRWQPCGPAALSVVPIVVYAGSYHGAPNENNPANSQDVNQNVN